MESTTSRSGASRARLQPSLADNRRVQVSPRFYSDIFAKHQDPVPRASMGRDQRGGSRPSEPSVIFPASPRPTRNSEDWKAVTRGMAFAGARTEMRSPRLLSYFPWVPPPVRRRDWCDDSSSASRRLVSRVTGAVFVALAGAASSAQRTACLFDACCSERARALSGHANLATDDDRSGDGACLVGTGDPRTGRSCFRRSSPERALSCVREAL